jgi:hypothetical protein
MSFMNIKCNVCIYICFILFPLLYCNYSFIYLYKGYASYIHISRGYLKYKRLRTTGLDDLNRSCLAPPQMSSKTVRAIIAALYCFSYLIVLKLD